MNASLKPIVVIGLAIAVMAAVSLYMHGSGKEVVPWREDYTAARAEAAAANKPVLLYFTAPWCGPCDYMKRTTWASNDVKDSLAGYVPVKVNIDNYADLARQFGIETIPRVFVIEPSGRVVRDYNGAMTAEEFVAWIGKRS